MNIKKCRRVLLAAKDSVSVKVKPSKLQVSHPVVLVGSGGEIWSGWMSMNSEPISVLRSVEEADKGMLTLTNNSTGSGR